MIFLMKITLNPYLTEPLYRQLKNAIKQAILTGELKHEHILPSENECVMMYDISSTVVKQAYQALEEENLIFRVKGKGSFVYHPQKITINLPFVVSNSPHIHFKVHNIVANEVPESSYVSPLFTHPSKVIKIKRTITMDNLLVCYQEVFMSRISREDIVQYMEGKIGLKALFLQRIAQPQHATWENKHGMKKASAIEAEFLEVQEGYPLHKIASYIHDQKQQLHAVIFTFLKGDIVALRYDKKL
jgi:DNA-binding GntR family transcriptional regulator